MKPTSPTPLWCLVSLLLAAIPIYGCSSGTSQGGTPDASLDVAAEASTHSDAGKDAHKSEDAHSVVCSAPQKLCGTACTTVASDPENCGTCGTKCAAGSVCSLGACALTCAGGTSTCGQACVDEANDPTNCGGCGNRCGAGQVCSARTCGSTCSGGQTVCGVDAGAPYCANEQTDNANCGGCRVQCTGGQVCSAGHCGVSCVPGEHLCPGASPSDGGSAEAGSGPYCANEATDNNNCGACETHCAAGQVCSGGTCSANCGAGSSLCAPDGGAPYCATESTDNNNCGGCGIKCSAQQVCSGGNCGSTCVSGQALCPAAGMNPAYCATESTDNNNCGGCGIQCTAQQVCSGGNCGSTCVGGQALCPAAGVNPAYCANESTDNNNCGACGMQCPTGLACISGSCGVLCNAPETLCNGACVNRSTDTSNCGACGNPCAAGGACTGGFCGCPAGDLTCGAAPGTCTNPNTDPQNCGGCGQSCPSEANSTPYCGGGSCAFVCAMGFADCNQLAADGCEINLQDDTSHCGSCGNVCPGGSAAVCSAGTCTSVVYAIQQAGLVNQFTGCGNTNDYNNCNGGAFGFTWTDTGAQAVSAVTIDFDEGVNCTGGGRTVLLNGTSIGTFNSSNQCTCNANPIESTFTLSAAQLPTYVVGGVNTVSITGVGNCEGISHDPNYVANAFAQIVVSY